MGKVGETVKYDWERHPPERKQAEQLGLVRE
jgi:hypothetical protein